ncbi:MAG: PepSY-associated TM helix domain-containing protein [Bryobacteraceae bacterium]
MNSWERWLRRPKSLWVRKALFQVHLWTGIALGLYVFVISVSGSAIVFRNELYTSLWPGPRMVAAGSHRLTHNELRAAALRAYPQYKVSWIWDAKTSNQAPNRAIDIWLDRNGHKKERLFDPYTGQDLGESRPYSIQLMAWLLDLHVNLLSGKTGRLVNGICAVFVLALAVSGAVLWWPGTRSWRRGFVIRGKSNWKLLNWQLHNVIGLWMLPIVLMFGLVGVYAGFPGPFQTLVNKIAPLDIYRPIPDASLIPKIHIIPVSTPTPRPRFRPRYSTGDEIIRWFSYLHFGNFGGWASKALWVVIGLAPAFLFVTGVLMWWNRVLSPAARRFRRSADI